MSKDIKKENFSLEDKSLLDVINSSYLSVDDVKWLKSRKWFKRFLRVYSKELKKRYKNKNIEEIRKVEKNTINNKYDENDIEVLDFTKTISMPSKEVIEILDFTRTIDITDVKDIDIATNNAKKKVKKEKIVWSTILIISFIILIILIVILMNWYLENKKTNDMLSAINEASELKEKVITTTKEDISDNENIVTTTTKPSLYEEYGNMNILEVNFDNLKNINSDTVGWIKVNSTNINYPFVKASDNEYYLKHTYDKTSNKKGWVFLDYRNDIDNLGKNTILYAHGLVNNQMFGSLRKVLKSSWYNNKKNHIITIVTPNTNLKWQVFSVYTIEPESYYITTNFENDEEFDELVSLVKQRSIYDFKVDVSSSDKMLTLSSCYDDKKRMVLHAKLIN